MSGKDIDEWTYNWADGVVKLDEAFRGLNDSILTSLSGSKAWTVVSRMVSGSPFWKLQNKLRALTDLYVVYDKTMQQSVQRWGNLGEAMENYIKIKDKLPKGFQPGDIGKRMSGERLRDEKGRFRSQAAVKDIIESDRFKFLKERFGDDEATRIAEETMQAQFDMLDKFDERIKWQKAFGDAKGWKKLKMIATKAIQGLGSLFSVLWVAVIKPFLIFLGIAIVALPPIIVTLRLAYDAISLVVGYLKPIYEALGGSGLGEFVGSIGQLFSDLFSDYWGIISAAFKGNYTRAAAELANLLSNLGYNMLNIAFRAIKAIIKINVGLAIAGVKLIFGEQMAAIMTAAFKLLGDMISSIIPKKPKWLGNFAAGGTTGSGGMALVGENGPELVSLPGGARVHSNAQSRRMGGNNIHVHVNGRVGASDAEIRDIAQKVAREINIQMNRTSTSRGAF